MAKILFKIAKELNVGTATIVDHLTEHGFEIDNKPNAKITDEMYEELLREFESSIAVKEQADQLIIGSRKVTREEQKAKEEEEARKKREKEAAQKAEEEEVKKQKEEEEEKARKEKEEEEKKQKEKEAAEKKKEEAVQKAEEEKEEKKGVKVVGKIELDEKGEKKKEKVEEEETKEKKEEEEVESKEEKEPSKEEEEKSGEEKEEGEPKKDEEEAPKSGKEEEGVYRAESPKLKGLKILGKIDKDKLEKRKRKPKSKKKKRKRKRKKVAASKLRKKKGKGKGKDEPKEVSQKEIEERIKKTKAKLQRGGKKSKRKRIRRDQREERKKEKEEQELQEEQDSTLEVTEFISVSDLASLMDVPVTDVITTCMNLGVIVSINQRLDAEVIELVADEFDYEVEFISAEEQVDEEVEVEEDPEDLEPRSPIVTVMGHVDHGKTSLLDYIREANVASGEAGGITQHVGAYEVTMEDGRNITFLDTPGHEAFTAMRARGAKVTDLAIIIIAADDNIMPQTKEAISHAQAAGVPIVFAINKIDKEGADSERIKQELANENLLVEDWGGDFQSADISAKTGQNVDELLEKILLEAEFLDLKANPNRLAKGVILEASLERGRGYVANALVQTGTLRIGDVILAGEYSGRVKAMFNEFGQRVEEAGPSYPVKILGLDGAPQAGEVLKVMESEQEARAIATKRSQIMREQDNRASKRISLDEIGRRLALGTFKELNLIVKGDVDGSVEALSDSLIKLSQETVQVNVIHRGVGQIVESDVLLATASDAIIIGFQVRPSSGARKLAEKEGVQIRTYSVIYKAIDEVKAAIEGMLEPTKEEQITAQLEVRDIFKVSKVGTVAGCYVDEGKITRNTNVRVIRDGIVIYPTKEGVIGKVSSLKRFKDDVREVKAGFECGLTIENFNDIKVGDQIEGYDIVEIKQTLED